MHEIMNLPIATAPANTNLVDPKKHKWHYA